MKIKRKCTQCGKEFKVEFILFETDWNKLDMRRNRCSDCMKKIEFMMQPEEVEKWDRETRLRNKI